MRIFIVDIVCILTLCENARKRPCVHAHNIGRNILYADEGLTRDRAVYILLQMYRFNLQELNIRETLKNPDKNHSRS